MIDAAKMANRVDTVKKLLTAEIFARFRKRGNEVRMLRAGQRDHGKAMRKRSQAALLVWRAAGRNKKDLVKIEAPISTAGDCKMTVMNGIEGAAKKRNVAG